MGYRVEIIVAVPLQRYETYSAKVFLGQFSFLFALPISSRYSANHYFLAANKNVAFVELQRPWWESHAWRKMLFLFLPSNLSLREWCMPFLGRYQN